MVKVSIFKEDDRLSVAAILVRNGYTVRQGSAQIAGKKSYDYFLEFDKGDLPEPETKKPGFIDKETVEEIRSLYVKGSSVYGAKPLSRRYGVSETIIMRAVKGE